MSKRAYRVFDVQGDDVVANKNGSLFLVGSIKEDVVPPSIFGCVNSVQHLVDRASLLSDLLFYIYPNSA